MEFSQINQINIFTDLRASIWTNGFDNIEQANFEYTSFSGGKIAKD